jgi:hypothetical protein
MSFFINSAASQKTNVILKTLDDWNEWIMIIKTIIKRDDVERYVNLIRIESIKSIELDLYIFFTIKIDAIIQLICRSTSNVISPFCEKIIRIRCVDIKKNRRSQKSEHFHTDVNWSIQFNLSQRSENDSSEVINFKKTFCINESSSKTRDDSQIQRSSTSAQTSTVESMTVELREDLCEDKTIEFIWRSKKSMCVRFSKFAAHDKFVICVW